MRPYCLLLEKNFILTAAVEKIENILEQMNFSQDQKREIINKNTFEMVSNYYNTILNIKESKNKENKILLGMIPILKRILFMNKEEKLQIKFIEDLHPDDIEIKSPLIYTVSSQIPVFLTINLLQTDYLHFLDKYTKDHAYEKFTKNYMQLCLLPKDHFKFLKTNLLILDQHREIEATKIVKKVTTSIIDNSGYKLYTQLYKDIQEEIYFFADK